MNMKPNHPAIKWEQVAVVRQFGDRHRATDNCDRADPTRHLPCARESIRGAPRKRHHMKAVDGEMICELLKNIRPIQQSTIRLESGSANSRPIWGDDSQTELARRRVSQFAHRSRTRPTVKKEDWQPIGTAIFGIRQSTPARQ